MPSLPDPSSLLKDVSTNIQSDWARTLPPRALSPASASRIQVKNRRKCYLDLHPEYLDSPSLELADPLAYDRLVRRFQSATERESEGKKKGYSGVLEADLWRSEAKIAALASPNHAASTRYRRGGNGEIVAEERDEVPGNKEEGLMRWRKEMELRFLTGEDEEFEYGEVDENELYDHKGVQEREEEERWFEEEEPTWVGKGDEVAPGEATNEAKDLLGQTGIQDF